MWRRASAAARHPRAESTRCVVQLGALLHAAPWIITGRRWRGAWPPRLRFVYLDHGTTTRYRVYHQIGQASLAGLSVENVPLS